MNIPPVSNLIDDTETAAAIIITVESSREWNHRVKSVRRSQLAFCNSKRIGVTMDNYIAL